MLTRIRIEVEGEDSAAAAEEALTKYEHSIQVAEYERRYVAAGREIKGTHALPVWNTPVVNRDFYNERLGREVTDEVIEYDPSLPGYKGRRVVQYRRIDTRSRTFAGEPRKERCTCDGKSACSLCPEPATSNGISFAAPDKAAA